MRCPKCSGWVTPDLQTCPSCKASIGDEKPVGSVAERHRHEIDRNWETWKNEMPGPDFESVAGAPSFSSPVSPVAAPNVAASGPPVEVEPWGILNFLLLHAGWSPFRSLKVRGDTRGKTLRVRSVPEMVQAATFPLGSLAGPGEPEPPVLTPSYEKFFALDEAIRAQLDVEVVDGDKVLFSQSFPVTAQNPNEWINGEGVEAALAGVVTPNAKDVVEAVAALSGDWVGYQARDPRRIRQEAARIYTGIAQMGLSYIGIPPSFEGSGQKVLFPDEVLAARRGCCIDLATLTAAMLERAGHNPVIVLVEGHAYTGVWTSDIRAKQPVLHDAAVVAECVEKGDLLVWNSTTYFGSEDARGFETAEKAGVSHLGKFRYLLDLSLIHI